MVILTVISVLVVNARVGRSVPGGALRMPVPIAPGSGQCLSSTPTGWIAVDCADPHTAEIVQSWSASVTAPVTLYEKCMTAGRAYLGDQWGQSGDSPVRAAWSVPPVMSSTVLVSGPGLKAVKGWSWQACVVRPILLGQLDGYRGRLRDVPATGVLPVELRPCFNRPAATVVVGVACTAPHTGEVLAARPLQVFGSTTQSDDDTATSPEVNAECLGIARRTTAAADPTYGGRLEVVVNLHATGMGFEVSTSATNSSQSYVLYQASCALQVATGQELSASIVGLGSRPLPIH
jgi:hypothetical protein